MTTFIFFVAFALFALQGSMSVSSVSIAAKQLNDNVDDIMAKHNVKALTVELTEDIEKHLKTSEKNERLCGPKVYQLLENITKESEVEAGLCVSMMGVSLMNPRDALKELDLCMSRVETKVSLEGNAIVYTLNQCIDNVALLFAKSLPTNVDDILAKHNVKALTVELKEGIEKLLKTSEKNERLCGPKVYQLLENITKESEVEAGLCVSMMGVSLMNPRDALKELDLCMSRVETKVSLEGHAIVYTLNQCIDNVALLFAKSLPTNVDDILAKHNVKALTVELKEGIEKLLKTSEKNERLCGPKVYQLLENITKESEVEAGLCVSMMGVSLMNPRDALKELDLCMSRVETKVSLEGHAIVYTLNQCIDNVALLFAKSLPTNVDDIVANHNVKALTVELKEEIEKLLKTSEKNERLCGPKVYQLLENITKESEVEAGLCVSMMGVSLMNPRDALKELDLCMSRVETKVSLEGNAIVYTLNQCIDNVALLFAKSLPTNVDDILAKHNVKALTVELKEGIEKLLKTSEKNERLCGPKVYQLLENITKESEVEAGLCVSMMGVSLMNPTDALKELDLCMSRVETKVSLEGHAIVYDLNKCIDNVALLY